MFLLVLKMEDNGLKIIIIALVWGFLELIVDFKSKSFYKVNDINSNNKIYEEIEEPINTSNNEPVYVAREEYEESVLEVEQEKEVAELFNLKTERTVENEADYVETISEESFLDEIVGNSLVESDIEEPIIVTFSDEHLEDLISHEEKVEENQLISNNLDNETIIWDVEVVEIERDFIHAFYKGKREWIFVGNHNYPIGSILRLKMDISLGQFDVLDIEELFIPNSPKTLDDFVRNEEEKTILKRVN